MGATGEAAAGRALQGYPYIICGWHGYVLDGMDLLDSGDND